MRYEIGEMRANGPGSDGTGRDGTGWSCDRPIDRCFVRLQGETEMALAKYLRAWGLTIPGVGGSIVCLSVRLPAYLPVCLHVCRFRVEGI